MGNSVSAREAFDQMDTDKSGELDRRDHGGGQGDGRGPVGGENPPVHQGPRRRRNGKLDFAEFGPRRAGRGRRRRRGRPPPAPPAAAAAETPPAPAPAPPPAPPAPPAPEPEPETATEAAEHAAEELADELAGDLRSAEHAAEHMLGMDGGSDDDLKKQLRVAQADACYARGETHEKMYDWFDAEREFREAMRLDPSHPKAADRHAHAEVQLERQRRDAEAEGLSVDEKLAEARTPMAQRTARSVLKAHAIDEATLGVARRHQRLGYLDPWYASPRGELLSSG